MLKYLSRNRRSSETQTNSHHDNARVARNSAQGQGHVQPMPMEKIYLYHIAIFFISSWNTIKLEHYIDSYYKILHAKVGINIYAKTMQLEVF